MTRFTLALLKSPAEICDGLALRVSLFFMLRAFFAIDCTLRETAVPTREQEEDDNFYPNFIKPY